MALPTINLAAFLDLVRPSAPSAPDPVIVEHLRLAATTFCTRTRCWRDTHTETITAQNQSISLPPYATILEVESAVLDGVLLIPAIHADFDPADFTAAGGRPKYLTQIAPNTLTILPFAAGGTLLLTAFWTPRPGHEFAIGASRQPENAFNQVPEFLYVNHSATIVAGALASLLALPNQPWTSPDLAMMKGAAFSAACDDAFALHLRGQQRAPLRTKAQFV
ncbi:hypothetical protein DSD19_04555 [Rhodovulum sp. BSW8]|uniref:phage adaptor protein n=1 Tax=Rhodovulum sp. BSW8 TaxID=2259645 RepID=UPI000DE47F93|nr:hypothetical protein [Rhodovulum sp. BSW8]RBO54652.1 hypothetical protein DSD19_04555 [Rhodovulum sp. BSW8]